MNTFEFFSLKESHAIVKNCLSVYFLIFCFDLIYYNRIISTQLGGQDSEQIANFLFTVSRSQNIGEIGTKTLSNSIILLLSWER